MAATALTLDDLFYFSRTTPFAQEKEENKKQTNTNDMIGHSTVEELQTFFLNGVDKSDILIEKLQQTSKSLPEGELDALKHWMASTVLLTLEEHSQLPEALQKKVIWFFFFFFFLLNFLFQF